MAVIRIDDKWAITSDVNQFTLNRIKIALTERTDKKGNVTVPEGGEYYDAAGYYYSLADVLKALPEKELKGSDFAGTLSEALDFLKGYSERIEALAVGA